jgi:hypothetical protein
MDATSVPFDLNELQNRLQNTSSILLLSRRHHSAMGAPCVPSCLVLLSRGADHPISAREVAKST